jgi:hypothetical protein
MNVATVVNKLFIRFGNHGMQKRVQWSLTLPDILHNLYLLLIFINIIINNINLYIKFIKKTVDINEE